MAVLDEVVATFLATWVTRDSVLLAQLGKACFAARENFVHVRLMAGVPQNRICGALEYAMQCDGEFHCAKV